MRYNLLLHIFLNIIILTCECGCPLLRILINSNNTTVTQENINRYNTNDSGKNIKTIGDKNDTDNINDTVCINDRKSSNDINEISYEESFSFKSKIDIKNKATLKKSFETVPGFSKPENTIKFCEVNNEKENVNINGQTEGIIKKKASDFINEYLSYTSKTAGKYNNDYSQNNYNNFKKFIENFVADAFRDIDKTENGLFLYYSIIAFFNTVCSPKSGTYVKEFKDIDFVKVEMNVKMRNLILLKLLCDVLDLNVISQNVTEKLNTIQFYTFISSFNIKSLFNYLTPENFSRFFFNEDYFKEYKRQLNNLKEHKTISKDTTTFYANNVVIRAFLNKFEVFKKNNLPDMSECKNIFSSESLDQFFVFVRKMIFNTSHLFMMFLYEKFDDCFLPLEEKDLTIVINSKDNFSKILNEALKEYSEKKEVDNLYKDSYYNDAAKNCISVIRNTIIVLNTIQPINKFVNKEGNKRQINFFPSEEQTLKDRMGIAPLKWLLTLIEDKDKVYTKSNMLTSLCNLYGQHKFLHYYLVKDDKNTIFPIQNKFYDTIFINKKEKPIYKCYKKISERIADYDNIFNFRKGGYLVPEVSEKRNSLFQKIIYK